ncbi:MAG: ATP-dependent DNA helicase RecQ, partial [Sediminibacterium sp.]|nr:ATP-dependent DNA helicase RecQ [Sediminibacterium sp.]
DIIAINKNLQPDELLEEMETIVVSGTKLNIDYIIDDMLDKVDQDEILAYFKSNESSSLQLAKEALAEYEYTWEQLKLMRIKFICEIGN